MFFTPLKGVFYTTLYHSVYLAYWFIKYYYNSHLLAERIKKRSTMQSWRTSRFTLTIRHKIASWFCKSCSRGNQPYGWDLDQQTLKKSWAMHFSTISTGKMSTISRSQCHICLKSTAGRIQATLTQNSQPICKPYHQYSLVRTSHTNILEPENHARRIRRSLVLGRLPLNRELIRAKRSKLVYCEEG